MNNMLLVSIIKTKKESQRWDHSITLSSIHDEANR